LGTADAYATAAFAMGSAGPRWTARLAGYGALTITDDDRTLATPGFSALRTAMRADRPG
jgi:FAD:protein FMN transferase